MAKATFNRKSESGKSSLISIRAKFSMITEWAYVLSEDLPDDIKKGDKFEIPDNYRLVPMPDMETGEVRKSKDGQVLHMLAF